MGGFRGIGMALAALAAAGLLGCGKADLRSEVVATANGDPIKVRELRESMEIPGGLVAASGESPERKKEAVGRLVAARLLAAEARSLGLDNSDAFRSAVTRNEPLVLVTALFRREVAKVKIADGDVRAEAKKLREADKNLSEKDAEARAGRVVASERTRKVESDIVAAAKKETPVTVDREMIRRVCSGEKVADNAVLGTAGGEKIRLAQAMAILGSFAGSAGPHGGQDLLKNPMAVEQVVDREATLRALTAYAKKQGVEGTELHQGVRGEMERSVLVGLILEKRIGEGAAVTDKEISDAYADHADRLVRDGRKIPLAAVKEQIRGFLANEKRKKALDAYIEELKKKAKITIDDSVLQKV